MPPPTEAMPVTPGLEEIDAPTPWFKKPGGSAIAGVAAALLIGALIFVLFWSSGDDDADVDTASVVFVPKDPTGAGLDESFSAEVVAASDFPNSFVWLEPTAAPGPNGIVGGTDGTDRVTFAWAPAAEVVEPKAWASTITLVGSAPAGFTPPGPVVQCVLTRPDQQVANISMDVVVDPPDPTVDQVVTYTFPNHEFLPGDTVTCELVSQLPPETTTTVPETTTTVPETTTTVPETTTTVPEATTTVPEATTTVPETTTTVPTVPATATEALQAAGNYSKFLALASKAPKVKELLDGDGPITVFAPNDDAFKDQNLPDGEALEELLLAHIDSKEALETKELFNGTRTDVNVSSGNPQPIDQDLKTIGGATVAESDLKSTNGVSHGIDKVLQLIG